MVFPPDGKFAYVINELSSPINSFSYDPNAGALKQLQEITTLPGYSAFSGASRDLQPGFGYSAGFPHRFRQRPIEALGPVRHLPDTGLRSISAAQVVTV